MLNPGGYLVVVGPDRIIERDTITCKHCNRIIVVAYRTEPPNTAFCGMCQSHICLDCETKGVCVPFEKKIKEIEEKTLRENHLRQIGLI